MNNNQTNNQSSQNKQEKIALDKIKKGEVKMRPKLYFVLKIFLWAIGIILVFIAGVYLTDLLFLVLHKSGLWFIPGFGPRGMMLFLRNFPWILLLITLIFIILLEILIRRFSVAYKRPLIYSILAVVVLVVLTGFFIQKSSFNRHIIQRAEEGRLPMTHHFYTHYGMQRPENIYSGIVVEINDNKFVIEQDNGNFINVEISQNTRLPQRFEIKEGDYVIIMGKLKGNIIKADGIRKISNREDEFGPLPPSPLKAPQFP